MRQGITRKIKKVLEGVENGTGCIMFFDRKPEALPLYETFEQKVFSELDGVKVKVQKTQIAFSNRHNFAFISFLPVRKAKDRPVVYIVVTFGLGYRLESPRIDAAVEPYPGRFTHHVLVSGTGEIDGEKGTDKAGG